MDTLTRRRLVAIGLSLSGAAALPRIGAAQSPAPPPPPQNALPDCPNLRGTIGDWGWGAHSGGQSVAARRVTIIERGIYTGIEQGPNAGKAPDFFLTLGNSWKLELALSRPPSSKNATLIVTGAASVTADYPSAGFKRSKPEAKTGSFYATLDVTPQLGGKANPEHAKELILELREGTKTLCKFAVSTNGFAEAVAKATAESQPIQAMYKNGTCDEPEPCYLTTLCVGLIGLPDDCFELRALRAYRDGPLRRLPNGSDIIAEYYAKAPGVVAEIKRRGEGQRVLRFYATHILPCVAFAKLGLNRLALWRYQDMMRQLQRAYVN